MEISGAIPCWLTNTVLETQTIPYRASLVQPVSLANVAFCKIARLYRTASCMPYDRSCSSHLALHGDRLHENPHASLQSLGRTQPPGRDYISTTIPARQLTLRDPWTPIKLHYARVSEISDIVDEGPGFEDSVGLRYSHHEAVRSAFLPTRSPQLYCKDGQQGPIDAQQQWQQTWLGNVYVYQDVENGVNGNGDPSASVSTSPTNSADTVISRIGKRKGPLSEPSRLNAKKMRKEVACFRCFIMREKCELDEESGHDGICVRCRELENNLRTWDLLCSREGLDQRGKFLVPTILVLQLEASHVRAFVKEHVQYLVPGSCIKLSLTMGFGEPLRINAVEVFPRGQEAARMLGFRPSETGSTTTTSLDSPPIIPSLTDRVAIDQHINHWLDTLIREPDSELPDYCFPEAHEQWEREMLSIICQYYQALDPDLETQGGSPYHTLALALRLTVLNYIMGHPFVVPDDEVEALTRQLQYHQPDVQADWICPRLANKIIKSMLLGMLKETINQVLDGLQKMLRRNASKEEDRKLWDPAFCIVFLCLIVVGKTQASLLERVEIGSANHDGPFLLHHAISTIEEMEKELSMHLIGMFHHKFGTARKANGKGKPFNPLARAPSDREQDATRLPALILEATGNYGR